MMLAVDDDPASLTALAEALQRRYAGDSRISAHPSASEALAKQGGEQVALVVADPWMPELNGIDLLGRAHDLHPPAQLPSVFAAGDVRVGSEVRVASAVGEGAAIRFVHEYPRHPVRVKAP